MHWTSLHNPSLYRATALLPPLVLTSGGWLHTVGEREECILLECFLVPTNFTWRIKRRERVTSTSTSRTQSLTIGHAIFNNLRKVPFFRLIFEISILESCIISLSFNSRSFLIVEDCVPNCQRLSSIGQDYLINCQRFTPAS